MDSSPEEVTTPPSRRDPPSAQQEDESAEEEEVAEEEDEESEESEEEEEDDDDGPPPSSTVIRSNPTLESLLHLRDLSKDVISWNLSSAKPGNGVEQIISDPSVETYWQSDGAQPHKIGIHFGRRVAVSHVCLYLDYNLDESYTPKTVQIKTGMTIQDLKDVTGSVDLHEPVGWCILPLSAPPDPLEEMTLQSTDQEEDDDDCNRPIKTHLVEISILAMHQNGRDTHVRRVKLFGPKRNSRVENTLQAARNVRQQQQHDVIVLDRTPQYTTVGMTQFNTIR